MKVFALLDDKTRPKAPPIPGATLAHRMTGRKLAMIHEMHIVALDETMAMMDMVEAGEIAAGELAEHIDSLELLKNYRAFGSLCGRECQFLDFHHRTEEEEFFPVLHANGDEGMKRVVERLADEHRIIGQILDELSANVALILTQPGPDTFSVTKTTFDVLYKVIRSHFSYEQAELEEALGFYSIPL
ncbi:hemerythrin domain-containing protein [Rhizobium leguminosarum]|uniref:hemerythrin domain-containing protein n=1 Tax=Rhizobium leguminosarum TaxID=384 RepID=UPI001FDFD411|nr:hemerythrin domain-containing protein [Rhizobium leguminosarum]